MPRGRQGRQAKTFARSARMIEQEGRARRHSNRDPQALLSEEAMRGFIEALMCPFCPRGPFRILANHTAQAHGVSAFELRDMAGLKEDATMCAPDVSAGRRATLAAHPEITASARAAKTGAKTGRQRFTRAGMASLQEAGAVRAAGFTPEQRAAGAQTRKANLTAEDRAAASRKWRKWYRTPEGLAYRERMSQKRRDPGLFIETSPDSETSNEERT